MDQLFVDEVQRGVIDAQFLSRCNLHGEFKQEPFDNGK